MIAEDDDVMYNVDYLFSKYMINNIDIITVGVMFL
jgi:hypothetical protein